MNRPDPVHAGHVTPAAARPIAIVGIGCRFADARGPDEFYEIVRSRRNTVRDVPRHRVELGYDIDHFFDPRPKIPGKIASKKAGFLERPELFDPEAFGIAPRDALTMEPQQRLMIEVTWDALDDAGIPIESVAGERVAVILGYMAEDYSRERAGVLGEAAVYRGHDVFTVGGMSHAVLSGRISFLLGVTGPSLTLDTACSSSLYAAHLACESLRRGESKLAIAGGVNLFLSPEGNIALSRSGMLSLSGACRAFDAKADGFVRAEGAGVVVLRPLDDALAAGNPIYAVIRGSGVSADGRDGGHMMAPGRKGQAQAMRDAYAMSGVSPADVHYVETHGTGTMIGDPVEIAALADVMGPGRPADRPLRVASIKGNLGHAESASGIAGLINAALAIRHRTLPPQLHFETPNPAIAWDKLPVVVQREAEPWPFPEPPLVGVNSFGISGTNAHFILEAAPMRASSPVHAVSAVPSENAPLLIPLSAHDPNALHEFAQKLHDQLAAQPDLDLRDLAYTLARRRGPRAHRLAFVAGSVAEARSVLETWLAGEASPQLRSAQAGNAGALVMVFPGQGSQWLGMGRQLLAGQPVFAAVIDRIDGAYRAHVEWSLRAVLEGRGPERGGIAGDWTARLDVLQPVLVAVEVALAELWGHFGVRPARVLGQSMGELAAAYVAGALALPDLARIACERGRIVARAAGNGAMAVVAASRDAVAQRLAEWPAGVEIAGSNSPTTTILSGDARAVAAAVDAFEAEGVFARRLEVDFASHCFHMDPLIEPFSRAIGPVAARPGTIPFDSTVDGETVRGEALDRDYWLRNLRAAVAFDRGLAASLAGGGEIFVEVSPHPSLPRAIDETAQSLGHFPRYVSSLRRGEDELRSLLLSLAELFVRGQPIDWAALHPEGRVVPLPLYAYQRKRYFFSERTRRDTFRPTHPLLGVRTDSSLDARLHSWDFLLDRDSGSFFRELREARGAASARAGGGAARHAPDALFVELALAAAQSIWPARACVVRAVVVLRPLALTGEDRRQVQVAVREEGPNALSLRVASRANAAEAWILHATAQLASRAPLDDRRAVEAASTLLDGALVSPLERTGNASLPVDDFYDALARCGVAAPVGGRALRELEVEPGGAGAVGKLMLPRQLESEWYAYHAHPLLLDAGLALAGALAETPTAVRVVGIESFELAGSLGSDCVCRARRRGRSAAAGVYVCDLDFFDRKSNLIGRIAGLRVEALPAIAAREQARASDWHRLAWRAADPALLAPAREVERFILVSDSEAHAAWVGAELEKQGVVVRFCEKVEDLEPLVRLHRATGDGRYGFLLLAWADRAHDAAPEPDFQREYRVGQWAVAIREQTADSAQIWIATRGLQSRFDATVADLPAARAAAGPVDPVVGAHVAREIDTFASCAEMQQCRLFDAQPILEDVDLLWLARLLGRPGDERQFVMTPTGAQVPRLEPILANGGDASGAGRADARCAAGGRNFALRATGLEGRAAVSMDETVDRPLAPDELRVEVAATSLSGFDVLTALGLEREAGERALGVDFAGRVLETGSAVAGLRVGDRVVGVAVEAGASRRRLVVARQNVARLPESMDFVQAVSEAWPALVADHVLAEVARLRAGERVLLLSAGGGVGLALADLAARVGARVHATASTAARCDALRARGARIEPLDEHRALAGREEAFDVIVGIEAGPALHGWLRTLAPGGRYVDLCPRERFERPELGTLSLPANRAYHAVDCVSALCERVAPPSGARESLADRLAAWLAAIDGSGAASKAAAGSSRVAASMPVTVFAAADAARALRFMSQNRQTGRVVLDFGRADATAIEAARSDAASMLAARRIVVSGAGHSERTAGFAAAIAAGLRQSGAKEVIELDGRAASADRIDGERDADAWIHLSDEAALGSDRLRHRMAAASARDRILISLREGVSGESDRDRAWEARLWIDRLVLGGIRSGRAIGLSLAAGDGVERALRACVEILGEEAPRCEQRIELVASELAERILRAPSPLISELASAVAGDPLSERSFDRAGFLDLAPPARRAAMLRHVVDELAGVLGLGSERRETLDPAVRLDALGLDSLMTMELFMGLGRSLELPLAADWFPAGPTLAEIAQVLVRRFEASLAGSPA